VDAAGERHGRDRRRAGGGHPRLADPPPVSARAHGGARRRGLCRLPRRGARDPEAKEQVELPRLREDWKARAAEHGLGRRELKALVHERSLARDHPELEQLAAQLLGREGLTERQTTFTMPELVQAVAGSLPAGENVDDVLAVAAELCRITGVELVEHGRTPGRPARFTTRELLEVEQEAVELAFAGRDVAVPQPERRRLAEALMRSGRELTGEQRMLVHQAATQPDRVVCVVGVAGSGKTMALRTLADAYRGVDATVLGAAPSGRAADELQAATGIASRTLHRLLLDARETGLPRRCLLVVDEAGMAETRVLAPLLRAVDRAEGKLLLVGDPAQLPAVGAGGLYQALCDRLGAIELAGNRRQREPVEREALARLRNGDPDPYLAHSARHGRLTIEDHPVEAKRRLLNDWWREAQRSPAGTVMLAYQRSDVDELNQAAHALMLRHRRLGRRAVTLGEREFRVSDQALCRRNDHRLGLRNGMRGTVVDLDDEALILRNEAGTERRVPFAYAAEHLDYGYALTGHAAQGVTSTARASSSTTAAPCRSGATSPAAAPASKPASTWPTATCSNARHPSASPTRPPRPSVPPGPSNAPPPSHSRLTSAENGPTRS
jgi:hypothetical protein